MVRLEGAGGGTGSRPVARRPVPRPRSSVEEPRRHVTPVRRPLPVPVRWVVLAAGGAAFAGVAELVPGQLPFVAVALWAVAALTVPSPRHLAMDGVALGLVVSLVVAVRDAPVPFALTAVLVLVGARPDVNPSCRRPPPA